jgi:hypothetical protein
MFDSIVKPSLVNWLKSLLGRKSKVNPAPEELWIQRFLGPEVYHIESAEWNLYRDEEDGRMNLWISVVCDRAIRQFDDTAYTNTIPGWELNLVEPHIDLREGLNAYIPSGYYERRRGWITNFYACSHDGSDKNRIIVKKRDGDRLFLRLTGVVVDPNFYDGSKPKSHLTVETWFTKTEEGVRSMS